MTTGEVLEKLASDIDAWCSAATSRNRAPALAGTLALDGLSAQLRNSLTISSAISVLQHRLATTGLYVKQLEDGTEEELQLSGVPCPQCETGQLIHWPVWR